MNMRVCANPDCQETFTPKAHNAIYCGDECRKLITNRKVLDKYYENKTKVEKIKNSKRVCSTKTCSTILSIYNNDDICSACQTEMLILRLASWGWDENALRDEWAE